MPPLACEHGAEDESSIWRAHVFDRMLLWQAISRLAHIESVRLDGLCAACGKRSGQVFCGLVQAFLCIIGSP